MPGPTGRLADRYVVPHQRGPVGHVGTTRRVGRLPSGDADEFHGLGDFIVTPEILLTRPLGIHAIHANVGFEANADDLERCRVRYGIAASLRVLDGLSVLAELTGSSGIYVDRFTASPGRSVSRVPPFPRRPFVQRPEFDATVARTDIIDAGIGVKGQLFRRLVGFASVLFPLTSDGVRADFVPVGGLEMTF